MKTALAAALVALTAVPPAAGTPGPACQAVPGPGCVAWATLDTQGTKGNAVAFTPDGGTAVIAANGMDIAYDAASGLRRWATVNGSSAGADIAVSPDGAFVASTGESRYQVPGAIGTTPEMRTTLLDAATGDAVWSRGHRTDDDKPVFANAVVVAGSRVFVAGGRNVPYRMVTVAYDVSGQELWSRDYDGPAPGPNAELDEAVDITASPDGSRVYVTGFSHRVDTPYMAWATVAYDGATGDQLWVRRLESVDESHAEPRELALSRDGRRLYVTGYAKVTDLGGASFDVVTAAYDTATGLPVWQGGYRGSTAEGTDMGWSLDLSDDGTRVYVAAYSQGAGTNAGGVGYQIEARDALTGTQLWSTAAPMFSATADAEGLFGFARIRESADGGQVYAAFAARDNGSIHEDAFGAGPVVFGAMAMAAEDGRMLWREPFRHTGRPRAYARSLGVSPDGSRVVITGWGDDAGTPNDDPLTVAFATDAGQGQPQGGWTSGLRALSASAGGDVVTIQGEAAFRDVPITVATDPTGDALVMRAGSDLRSATMALPDPSRPNLEVGIRLADAIPSLTVVPEAITYRVPFAVPGQRYLLEALMTTRGGEAGSGPVFRLLRYEGSSCCTFVSALEGGIAADRITWEVPLEAIGASQGTPVTAHPDGPVEAMLGAPEAPAGSADTMVMTTGYQVPGRTVRVGIAPLGTPVSQVPLTADADVEGERFVASVPAAGGGGYVVVAEACFGPYSCGRAWVTI